MNGLAHQVRLLVCATQFLTRAPTPGLKTFSPDWITRSARYFPLVGQGVGLVCAGVLLIGDRLWSAPVGAILALVAGLLITGALHEDGLADTADGLGGGPTPERRLEIMKDSRIGVYGVCALVGALALKAALLAQTPGAASLLLAVHGLGRAAAVVVMRLTPYAPGGAPGKWTPSARGVQTGEVVVALLIAAWPLLLLSGAAAALCGLATGTLLAAGLALAARRLIGGHTGDVLGAVEQVFEVGFLLGAAALT